MGRGFYLKLAINNLKRNKKSYLPYFIAATIMISVFFMVLMIIYSDGIADVPEGGTLQSMFMMGFIILTLFVIIFMLYINSFLIKQRKKELGLYGILGLEKRHVGRIMLWENVVVNGLSLVLGILSACVFGWLIFLLLMKSIQVTKNSYFDIPLEAFVITLIVFSVIYVLISIMNLLQIRLANPIDLLKSKNQGEKKVRFLIPTAIAGVVLLGWAYYIALTVKNPFTALNQFFIAVIMVIFATNFLFTAGSNILLRILKNNKRYYYKPDNFVSISGMFHRMKQNAAGLALICILSTMVLVTVSTCVALFIGQEDTLKTMNKDDTVIQVTPDISKEQIDQMDRLIQETADTYHITIEESYHYYSINRILYYQNNTIVLPDSNFSFLKQYEQDSVDVEFILLEDYNRILGMNEKLEGEQLILLANETYKDLKEINAQGETYEIIQRRDDTPFTNGKNRSVSREIFIVCPDTETSVKLVQEFYEDFKSGGTTNFVLNIQGEQEYCFRFSEELRDKFVKIAEPYGFKSIHINRVEGYSIYGGLLFLGAFFTILFLTATVLIIYFKQISEGYDDKEQYVTLQKVGMDDIEVKRTINKQILTVFFLPLIGALMHVAMASNMIIKMLAIFYLQNVNLTVLCILTSSAIFTLAYIFVYNFTAKTYYRIIKW